MNFPFKKYRQYSDEKLLVFISEGNQKAFDELYLRYGKKLHYYFYQAFSKDSHKADDFLQDLFVKIFQNSSQFDPQRKFSTWIYSIAANMCKNEFRSMQVRSSEKLSIGIATIFQTQVEDTITKFDLQLFGQHLDLALQNLSEDQRTTFILRYQQELPIKEIAEIMDCAEGTVKSRLYYALQILSEKLAPFNPNT